MIMIKRFFKFSVFSVKKSYQLRINVFEHKKKLQFMNLLISSEKNYNDVILKIDIKT